MRRPGRHEACAVALSVVLLSVACRGGDGPPAPECVTDLVTDVTFDLEPAAAAPQIHADAAFDGSTVWLAYNRPDDEGEERHSVFLRRIHCDGTAASLSMRVNTTQSSNDLGPSIAVADGTIAITWTSDSGVGANNMDAMYRTWGTNHDPRMQTDVVLETEHAGEPVVGNVVGPVVAAVGNGQFAVAGVRTFEATGRSQAFVQRRAAAAKPFAHASRANRSAIERVVTWPVQARARSRSELEQRLSPLSTRGKTLAPHRTLTVLGRHVAECRDW